jgi:S-DNA-T family DNA segregation ATPase FtsK/SpoIIIE
VSTRTKRPAGRRRDAARNKQSRREIAAILLLATGAIVAAGLLLGDRGVVGEVAAEFLRMVFGIGAWLVPPLLWVFAGALAFGRQLRLPRFVGGLSLIILAVLGFAARQGLDGDWFDPVAVSTGGGYVGAALAWSTHLAFGLAAPIALGAMAALGLVAATSFPLFSFVAHKASALWGWAGQRLRRRRVAARAMPSRLAKLPVEPEIEQPERPEEPATPEAAEPPSELPPDTAVVEMPKRRRVPPEDLEGERRDGYVLPPLKLLNEAPPSLGPGSSEVGHKVEILERTLDEFGIEADVVEVARGPTVTRYEIQLGPGIKVSKIVSLADNLAMSLAAIDVRVEAPIPGKSAIGVEVPNSEPAAVSLKEVLGVKKVMELPQRLIVALGKDVGGEPRWADLAKMPHVLIGGATNAGKSIALSAMITSLLMRNTPHDVRLVLIDPKRVELSLFDGIPHLMCPVVREVKKTASVFKSLLLEMDRRYDLLSESGSRNIDLYNEKVSFNEKLPYVVVLVDELADLMMREGAEIEQCICRLAQLARATGIHLVLATQRPSVDVITGTIKTNISSRIAFAMTSAVDSRTILDQNGADRLIGRGDMLYQPIDAAKPTRIQGCYISEAEIAAVVQHWQQQDEPEYALEPVESDEAGGVRYAGDEEDPRYLEAVRLVVSTGHASASMLQRRLRIGYQRASRLVDIMEAQGLVGPLDGPRPREILITAAQWADMSGEEP